MLALLLVPAVMVLGAAHIAWGEGGIGPAPS